MAERGEIEIPCRSSLDEKLADAFGGLARRNCDACPVGNAPEGTHKVMWIGRKTYTVASFCEEPVAQGISRRLRAIPRDFEVGETVVYLAHVDAVEEVCEACSGSRVENPPDETETPEATSESLMRRFGRAFGFGEVEPEEEEKPKRRTRKPKRCPECKGKGVVTSPGLFGAYKPTHIEYIVKGDESEEDLGAMEERGVKLVRLVRTGEGEAEIQETEQALAEAD